MTFDWKDLDGKTLEIIVRSDTQDSPDRLERKIEITCVFGYDKETKNYYCLATEEKEIG